MFVLKKKHMKKNKRLERKKLSPIVIICALMFPLFLFLTLEVLNTESVFGAYLKVFSHCSYTFLSYIAISASMLIIFCLCNNLFLSGFLTSILLYIFYVVNFYRKEITGWAFVPADLGFLKNAGNLASFAHLKYHIRIGASAAVIIFLLTILFVVSKRIHVKFKKRLKILLPTLFIFWFMFFTSFAKLNIMPLFGLDSRIKLTVNQIYQKYGVIMGFYVGYNQATNLKPDNYSEDKINEIAGIIEKNYQRTENIFNTQNYSSLKPNVIIIMSEAFSDPTRWSNINFSDEPIPTLKKLQSESIFGNIISPVFGGSTCNVEYEFNTCNSLYFFKSGVVPYEEIATYFTNENMVTVPKLFKANGYKTIGLHTYEGTFFNRDKIYPLLGFDEFISAKDMKNAEIKGNYISDKYFTDRLIKILEQKDSPLFLYGITMENHYPFQPKKFDEPDPIKSSSELLTENQLASVDSYLHGISDADQQLKRITDYLKNFDEPTIVIFFGDHLPILADSGFGVYADLKYIPSTDNLNWSAEDYYKMYTTPYVIWNNFDNKNINLGDISPYFLSNYLLDMVGIEKPARFKFMNIAYEKFHGLKENLFIDAQGKKFNVVQNENIANMFWNLQYDSIWGQKYLKN